MKRICFLLNNDFTADNRVRREAEALAAEGHHVILICVRSNQANVPRYERMDLHPGRLEVYRLLKRRLYKYHAFSFRLLKAFTQIFSRFAPAAAVHAHDANMLPLGWFLARAWQSRLVYDSHEYWHALFMEEKERLLDALNHQDPPSARSLKRKIAQVERFDAFEGWALPKCDAVISVSNALCHKIAERAIRPIDPPVLLRNIPEPARVSETVPYSFHQEFNLSPERKILLYQGQIAEKRGISVLISALEALPEETCQSLALVLMGPVLPADEPYRDALLKRVSANPKLENVLFFKPPVPARDVLSYTAAADLGIHPILNTSENHYYCLPNKIFEYLEAGLPVAVSAFPEMKAIVDTYGIGFTFDPDQPADLAQALTRFLREPDLAQRYRQHVQEARTVLNWEHEKQVLLTLYNSLWASTSRGPVRATMPENDPLNPALQIKPFN